MRNTLKIERKLMGISQTALGKLVGVSRQSISYIEQGKFAPSVKLALKFGRLFNKRVACLFILDHGD
jgi:putative transcriptional regulator